MIQTFQISGYMFIFRSEQELFVYPIILTVLGKDYMDSTLLNKFHTFLSECAEFKKKSHFICLIHSTNYSEMLFVTDLQTQKLKIQV